MSSDMDILVMEHTVLEKARQNANVEGRVHASMNLAEHDPALESVWRCPACSGQMSSRADTAQCTACNRSFRQQDGIWAQAAAGQVLAEDAESMSMKRERPRRLAEPPRRCQQHRPTLHLHGGGM